MSNYSFIAGAAVLACTSGLAFGQCDVDPASATVTQNDPAVCGGDDPANDPNFGCDAGAVTGGIQDLGALAAGDTVIVGTCGFSAAGATDYDAFNFELAAPGFITYTIRTDLDGLGTETSPGIAVLTGTQALDCSEQDLGGFYLLACDAQPFGTDVFTAAGRYGIEVFNFDDGTESYTLSDCATEYSVTITYTPVAYAECGDPASGNCTEITPESVAVRTSPAVNSSVILTPHAAKPSGMISASSSPSTVVVSSSTNAPLPQRPMTVSEMQAPTLSQVMIQ